MENKRKEIIKRIYMELYIYLFVIIQREIWLVGLKFVVRVQWHAQAV